MLQITQRVLVLALLLVGPLSSGALAQLAPEELGAAGAETPPPVVEIDDPFEGFNRRIFWFNDKLDIYFIEPLAEGYDYVVPNFVQQRVRNFFENIGYPVYLLSDVVQLKFGQAAHHTGRFVLNTTVGLAGLFDVATDWGLPRHKEDFGIALGYHGVPPGPYLVLPLLGPSNVRDLGGRIVDAFLDPFYYTEFYIEPSHDAFWLSAGVKTVEVLQTRADLLDAVQDAKDSSLDYYLFIQSTYYQVRQNLIHDNRPPSQKGELSLEDELELEP